MDDNDVEKALAHFLLWGQTDQAIEVLSWERRKSVIFHSLVLRILGQDKYESICGSADRIAKFESQKHRTMFTFPNGIAQFSTIVANILRKESDGPTSDEISFSTRGILLTGFENGESVVEVDKSIGLLELGQVLSSPSRFVGKVDLDLENSRMTRQKWVILFNELMKSRVIDIESASNRPPLWVAFSEYFIYGKHQFKPAQCSKLLAATKPKAVEDWGKTVKGIAGMASIVGLEKRMKYLDGQIAIRFSVVNSSAWRSPRRLGAPSGSHAFMVWRRPAPRKRSSRLLDSVESVREAAAF